MSKVAECSALLVGQFGAVQIVGNRNVQYLAEINGEGWMSQ